MSEALNELMEDLRKSILDAVEERVKLERLAVMNKIFRFIDKYHRLVPLQGKDTIGWEEFKSMGSVKKEVEQLIDEIVEEVTDVAKIEGLCRSCADNCDQYITVDNKTKRFTEKTDYEKMTEGILSVISKHKELLKAMIK